MTEYLFLKLEIIITKFQFELEVSISSFLHPHEAKAKAYTTRAFKPSRNLHRNLAYPDENQNFQVAKSS